VKNKEAKKSWVVPASFLYLASCAALQTPPKEIESKRAEETPAFSKASIPKVVHSLPPLPAPDIYEADERYTIVVENVPIQELLFSLARDAKLNLDIDPQINGHITLNAVNQTLPNILKRMTDMVPLRYQVTPESLKVQWDTPYQKIYRINYLNMSRTSSSSIKISTTVSSTGSGDSSSQDNISSTEVINKSDHLFWETLEANLKNILNLTRIPEPEKNTVPVSEEKSALENPPSSTAANEKDTPPNNPESAKSPEGSNGQDSNSKGKATEAQTSEANAQKAPNTSASAESSKPEKAPAESQTTQELSPITINKESSIVAVFATQKQHQAVQSFLDEVLISAKRQVLIEATVVEVSLSDEYQSGVDWRLVQSAGTTAINNNTNPTGFNLFNEFSEGNLGSAPHALIKLTDTAIDKKRLDVTIKALETFGDVKVMSRPKLTAINNQTALLKVIDNAIYFSITSDKTVSTEGVANIEVNSEIKSVPVGLVMSVTPFIDEYENVTLNVRPTISRIIDTVLDPTPDLAEAGVTNKIPVIQVREVESLLKVKSGETAVIGGLMQEDNRKESVGIPYLQRIPYIGRLFSYKEDIKKKTELVIFIRPIIVLDRAILEKNHF